MANRRSIVSFGGRQVLILLLLATCLYYYCNFPSNDQLAIRLEPRSLVESTSFADRKRRADPEPQGGNENDSEGDSDDEEADEPAADVSSPEEIAKHWQDSLGKGCRLHQKPEGEDTNIPATKWTDWSELTQYGWSRQQESNFQLGEAVAGVMYKSKNDGGLGAPKDAGPPQVKVSWMHNAASEVTYTDEKGRKKPYKATHGYYINSYYPDQGIIVASDNLGPQKSEEILAEYMDRELSWPVVPLKQWSDVIVLEWSYLTSEDEDKRKGMKHVVQATIVNRVTRNVIFKALENGRTDGPPKWDDAEECLIGTEKGKAILGTPNGGGLAWFLLQHQEQIGHKRIKLVVAFDDALTESQRNSGQADRRSFPSLVFNIEAADPFDDSYEIPDDDDPSDEDPFDDSNEIPSDDEDSGLDIDDSAMTAG